MLEVPVEVSVGDLPTGSKRSVSFGGSPSVPSFRAAEDVVDQPPADTTPHTGRSESSKRARRDTLENQFASPASERRVSITPTAPLRRSLPPQSQRIDRTSSIGTAFHEDWEHSPHLDTPGTARTATPGADVRHRERTPMPDVASRSPRAAPTSSWEPRTASTFSSMPPPPVMRMSPNTATLPRNPYAYTEADAPPGWQVNGHLFAQDLLMAQEYQRIAAASDKQKADDMQREIQAKVNAIIDELDSKSATYRSEFESLLSEGRAFMDHAKTISVVPNGKKFTITFENTGDEVDLPTTMVIMGLRNQKLVDFFDQYHIEPRIRERIIRTARVMTSMGRSENPNVLWEQIVDATSTVLGQVHRSVSFVLDFVKSALLYLWELVTIKMVVAPGTSFMSTHIATLVRTLTSASLTLLVTNTVDDWAGEGHVVEMAEAKGSEVTDAMQRQSEELMEGQGGVLEATGVVWDMGTDWADRVRYDEEFGFGDVEWLKTLQQNIVGNYHYTLTYGFFGTLLSYRHYKFLIKESEEPDKPWSEFTRLSNPFTFRRSEEDLQNPKTRDWLAYFQSQHLIGWTVAVSGMVPWLDGLMTSMAGTMGISSGAAWGASVALAASSLALNAGVWGRLAEARERYEQLHGTSEEKQALEEYYREARAACATLLGSMNEAANSYYAELCSNAVGFSITESVPKQVHLLGGTNRVHYITNICRRGLFGIMCRDDRPLYDVIARYEAGKTSARELSYKFRQLPTPDKIARFGHDTTLFVCDTLAALAVYRANAPTRAGDLEEMHREARAAFPCIHTYIWRDDFYAGDDVCEPENVMHLAHIICSFMSSLGAWSNLLFPAAVDDVECPRLRDRSSTEGMDDLALKGSCASSNYVFILMARIAREQIDRERSA